MISLCSQLAKPVRCGVQSVRRCECKVRGTAMVSWCLSPSSAAVAQENPDIVQQVARSFAKVQHPARHNTTYSQAIQEFRHWVILAYECGYREEDMVLKLTEACDLSASQIRAEHVHTCIEGVCIVWMTLEMSNKPLNSPIHVATVYWRSGRARQQALAKFPVSIWDVLEFFNYPAVTLSTGKLWKGFVRLIVDAYFEKRWAAYPVDRLQMELAAMGRIEKPDVVSEWSRLVYETLHHVAPQFPRD